MISMSGMGVTWLAQSADKQVVFHDMSAHRFQSLFCILLVPSEGNEAVEHRK